MIIFNLKYFSKENDIIILKISSAYINIISLDDLFKLNTLLFTYYTDSLTYTDYPYSESVKDTIKFNKKKTTLIYISNKESTNKDNDYYRDVSGYDFHILTPINTVEIIRKSILHDQESSSEKIDIQYSVTNNCYFILSPKYPLYEFVTICKEYGIIITGGPKSFEYNTQHSRLSNFIKNIGLKDFHLIDNHPNNNLIRKVTKKKKIYTLNSNKSYSTIASRLYTPSTYISPQGNELAKQSRSEIDDNKSF
uniref:hypothetical protein n=1 Tax=Conidiobolus mycophagus TaxID=1368622 RepID=UPI001D102CE9|nr:hypothetical protein LKZ63_mgp05 [Conidiobolus mycophagus]QZZ81340.1 hypothetical protein [Conidiobolus mycophagus]